MDTIGKNVRVEIWTDKYKLTGTLFLPLADTYSSRLSDFLNESQKAFFALTEVTVTSGNGDELLLNQPFLAVNKSAILLVRPLKE